MPCFQSVTLTVSELGDPGEAGEPGEVSCPPQQAGITGLSPTLTDGHFD